MSSKATDEMTSEVLLFRCGYRGSQGSGSRTQSTLATQDGSGLHNMIFTWAEDFALAAELITSPRSAKATQDKPASAVA